MKATRAITSFIAEGHMRSMIAFPLMNVNLLFSGEWGMSRSPVSILNAPTHATLPSQAGSKLQLICTILQWIVLKRAL